MGYCNNKTEVSGRVASLDPPESIGFGWGVEVESVAILKLSPASRAQGVSDEFPEVQLQEGGGPTQVGRYSPLLKGIDTLASFLYQPMFTPPLFLSAQVWQ